MANNLPSNDYMVKLSFDIITSVINTLISSLYEVNKIDSVPTLGSELRRLEIIKLTDKVKDLCLKLNTRSM